MLQNSKRECNQLFSEEKKYLICKTGHMQGKLGVESQKYKNLFISKLNAIKTTTKFFFLFIFISEFLRCELETVIQASVLIFYSVFCLDCYLNFCLNFCI